MCSRPGRSFWRPNAKQKFPIFKIIALNVINQTSIAM